MIDRLVNPYEGFGPLRFGMSSAACAQVMGYEPRIFEKWAGMGGVQVRGRRHLSLLLDADELEFVEVGGGVEVRVGDCSIGSEDVTEAVVRLTPSQGLGRDNGGGSVIFDATGLALYAPHGHIEGIAVARSGYYKWRHYALSRSWPQGVKRATPWGRPLARFGFRGAAQAAPWVISRRGP